MCQRGIDSPLPSVRPLTKTAKRVRRVITACGCSAAVMLSILIAWYKSAIGIQNHRMKIEAGREEKERRNVKKTAVLSSAAQPEPYLVLVVGMSVHIHGPQAFKANQSIPLIGRRSQRKPAPYDDILHQPQGHTAINVTRRDMSRPGSRPYPSPRNEPIPRRNNTGARMVIWLFKR